MWKRCYSKSPDLFLVSFCIDLFVDFLDKPRPGGHTAMGKDALILQWAKMLWQRAREGMNVGPVNVRGRLIDIL